MRDYFKLQYIMLNRKMDEMGISPIIGYLIAIIAFFGVSIFLFSKTEYAEFFYGLISISLVSKLSEKKRNDFLKTIFSINNYRKLRILENLIIAFPFIVFLLFKQSYIFVTILLLIAIIMSIINYNNSFNYTIPTPFSKKPFEFLVGFRKTFFVFPFAYFFTYQSILVTNFNLGVASLILIAAIVISYYTKPENEIFIWSFKFSAKKFLINKIKIGFIYFTFLSAPIVIFLMIFFPYEKSTLIFVWLIAYAYIATIILAKYSAYPNEMNLPESLLIGLSIMFPPILLGIIPYFYFKSIKQLNPILEND